MEWQENNEGQDNLYDYKSGSKIERCLHLQCEKSSVTCDMSLRHTEGNAQMTTANHDYVCIFYSRPILYDKMLYIT
jgi:hypothetical protein